VPGAPRSMGRYGLSAIPPTIHTLACNGNGGLLIESEKSSFYAIT
jgi:hypothetical protein